MQQPTTEMTNFIWWVSPGKDCALFLRICPNPNKCRLEISDSLHESLDAYLKCLKLTEYTENQKDFLVVSSSLL